MSTRFPLRRASAAEAPEIAPMVGELLTEIMDSIGVKAFNFDLAETTDRLAEYLEQEKYVVFVADSGHIQPVGFIALYESQALYAEGRFGTIPEFYVRPECRSNGTGRQLMTQAKVYAAQHGWTRLEVTTPPLPLFNAALAFYEREGFSITGGRKLKISL